MTLMKIAGRQFTTVVCATAIILFSIGCVNASLLQAPLSQFSENGAATSKFTEGPHIFYKKGKISVRNVHFNANGIKVDEQSFDSKSQVPALSCTVDNKNNTTFDITLHSEYKTPPTIYAQPKKLYAISDIEGHFDAFVQSLQGNGLIDKNLNWIYGKGHLVLVGDFFDRGHNVTPVLWLIYRLEQEAEKAGGMVHFILGNHEEMNMRGDVRYVKDRYIAAAKAMKMSYPSLYSKDTELGRWLRSKNIVEKIGKTIFVHGGLSLQIAKSHIRLEEMNKYARQYFGMDKFRLEQKGGGALFVFSKNGPMWYRGYFKEMLSQKELNFILDIYGADHVVVGHTIVPKVSGLFNGKVIAIDVKHNVALSEKTTNALLIESDKIYAVNVQGKKSDIENFMTEEIVVNAFNAVKNGNAAVVSDFLKSNDRVNKYFFSKRITLLQAAIHHDQPEMVLLLLEHGANIELLSGNRTPLMHAVQLNNQRIIDLLLEQGADINALNKQKKTPLFYCAKHGTPELAKILVEHGAKIDLKDGKGRTALEYAKKNDNTKVATYLETCKH